MECLKIRVVSWFTQCHIRVAFAGVIQLALNFYFYILSFAEAFGLRCVCENSFGIRLSIIMTLNWAASLFKLVPSDKMRYKYAIQQNLWPLCEILLLNKYTSRHKCVLELQGMFTIVVYDAHKKYDEKSCWLLTTKFSLYKRNG